MRSSALPAMPHNLAAFALCLLDAPALATPPPAPVPRLGVGARVVLTGLLSAPQLNGRGLGLTRFSYYSRGCA